MKYEYKDLFVKTCDEIDGKGSCKKSHMATKCINDKCIKIKSQNNKMSLIGGSLKNFKCKKCDYKTKDPVHLIKHTKKYHLNFTQKGSGCHHCSNEIKGRAPDPKLQEINKQKQKQKIKKQPQIKEITTITLNLPFIKKSTQKGSGKKQFYGKSSKVMIKVPENVKKTALYAFKLKKLGFKGGLETGWKRAKQLATKEYIPIEDLRYMRAWFARHIYSSYPTFLEWKKAGRQKDTKWHKVHGIISFLIWGGDAAFNWVNSQKNLNLLNKYFNKEYKSLKKRN